MLDQPSKYIAKLIRVRQLSPASRGVVNTIHTFRRWQTSESSSGSKMLQAKSTMAKPEILQPLLREVSLERVSVYFLVRIHGVQTLPLLGQQKRFQRYVPYTKLVFPCNVFFEEPGSNRFYIGLGSDSTCTDILLCWPELQIPCKGSQCRSYRDCRIYNG